MPLMCATSNSGWAVSTLSTAHNFNNCRYCSSFFCIGALLRYARRLSYVHVVQCIVSQLIVLSLSSDTHRRVFSLLLVVGIQWYCVTRCDFSFSILGCWLSVLSKNATLERTVEYSLCVPSSPMLTGIFTYATCTQRPQDMLWQSSITYRTHGIVNDITGDASISKCVDLHCLSSGHNHQFPRWYMPAT